MVQLASRSRCLVEFSARYELDPKTYERGGEYAPVPSGDLVDITALASTYGWNASPRSPIGELIMPCASRNLH